MKCMEIINKNAETLAYNKIKRAIILKRILPGQQLTEEWIGQNLQMSRTPVRAALKMLAQEGLIKIIQNRGAFVHQPTIKEMRDVFNVKILLETNAIRMATKTISDEYIRKLRDLLEDEIKSYKKRDFEWFIEINNQIHQIPAEVTGNKCLIEHVSSLAAWVNCYLILKDPFYKNPIDQVKSIPEHKRIVDALAQRDPDEAEKALRCHLETSLHALENNNYENISHIFD